MTRHQRKGWRRLCVATMLVIVISSCSDASDDQAYRDFGGQSGGSGNADKAAKAGENEGGSSTTSSGKKKKKFSLPEITESMFIVGPRHRDPFSPFLEILIKQEALAEVPIQREVKLKDYDISELKLIGIITNIGDPRAMVTTPDKTGFVLRRGDFVGRADFIKQGTSGAPIQVNWRVARIHGAGKEEERGIYLIREDPIGAKGVDVTRFIPLHPIE
jgi:Tfp pilus assembly protein PilP